MSAFPAEVSTDKATVPFHMMMVMTVTPKGRRFKDLNSQNGRNQEQSVSTTCRTFTAKEKYEVLEGVGARNQHYMAETPDEASKGFAAPTPEPQLRTFADTVETDADYCNEECQLIRTTLERVMNERSRTNQKSPPRALLTSRRALSDAGPMEVDEGVGQNQACALETFVPLGNCSEPGEEVSWAHEQLCSICRGIYILGENCFPTFFNSVLCNQQETGCIFDNFSNRAHGICRPETLSLRVLRNRGDTECEDWVIEQIELPVACQCLLSKGSWLRSRPPKEL
ncbi:hypothetical protein Q1695_002836 [Nippostrongylus brasiliensis]|nr:hypothetical protein Q1695_002836 [Nippostrongylus brasiliensis]